MNNSKISSAIQTLSEEFKNKLSSLSESLENPSVDEQKQFKKDVREFMKGFVPKLEKEILGASFVDEDEDDSSPKVYSKKELDAMKIVDLRKLAKDTFKLTINARTKKAEYVELILKKQSSTSKKDVSPKNSPRAEYAEVEEVSYEVIEKDGYIIDKETKKFVFEPKSKTVIAILDKGKLKPLRKIDINALTKKKIRMYHIAIAKREQVLKVDEIEELLKKDEEESSESEEENVSSVESIHENPVEEEEDDGSEDGKEIYIPETAFEEKDITEQFKKSLNDILKKDTSPSKKDVFRMEKEEDKQKIIPNLKKSPPKSTSGGNAKKEIIITKEDYDAFQERKDLPKPVRAEIIRNKPKYDEAFGTKK